MYKQMQKGEHISVNLLLYLSHHTRSPNILIPKTKDTGMRRRYHNWLVNRIRGFRIRGVWPVLHYYKHSIVFLTSSRHLYLRYALKLSLQKLKLSLKSCENVPTGSWAGSAAFFKIFYKIRNVKILIFFHIFFNLHLIHHWLFNQLTTLNSISSRKIEQIFPL